MQLVRRFFRKNGDEIALKVIVKVVVRLVVVGGSVCLLALYGCLNWNGGENDVLQTSGPMNELGGEKDKEGEVGISEFPPMIITFLGSVQAEVRLGFQTQIRPEDILRIAATYGNQNDALQALFIEVKGVLFRLLEGLTIDEARSKRGEIGKRVIEETTSIQHDTGQRILSFSLFEIIEIDR